MGSLAHVFARWRQLEGDYYTTGGDRFNPPGTDCSGGIVFANREDVPWLQRGNSASMAQYAVDHGLVKPLSQRKPGDLVIYDKYGQATQSNGPRGHIGQISEDINVTWEQASSRGCQRYRYARLGWVMCVNMQPFLRGGGATAPPSPHQEDDDLTPEQAKQLDTVFNAITNNTYGTAVQPATFDTNVKVNKLYDAVYNNGYGIGLQNLAVKIAQKLGVLPGG